jgi:beta-lactamase regulating signal transducer with metallopeptidase domain
MPSGLLLAFPLESVALRLALALGVALVLLRIVSTWDLRSPRARSVLAASPFFVAAAVVLLSSGDLGLPALLVPSTVGSGALALPVADRYLDFAPMAPVIVGTWAAITATLVVLRIARASAFRRDVLAGAHPAQPRVAAVVLRLARELGITPPRVLVVHRAVGGAAVLGVRDPVLLLDSAALERLDSEELEGVIAHELAHVARRDNLVAWAVAIVRDGAFFVPGAGWAVRALHREREAAADQDAVAATGRPAALASGLLHVVELSSAARRVPNGCAALVPTSSVVDRVELLLREDQATPREHRTELALAAAVSLVAVALAVVVPGLLAGTEGQRDALGVLVGSPAGATRADAATDVGRVVSVYRGLANGTSAPAAGTRGIAVRTTDLIGPEDRPGAAQACAAGIGCPTSGRVTGLALRPAPIVLLDGGVSTRWQATPVRDTSASDRFAVYWLARVAQDALGR